jgi:hypothetical protein
MVGLALAALPCPTAQTGSDRPSLSRSAPGIVPPHQLFATDDANETLHFDTDPSSGIGLTSGGTFWGGARFTPTTGCTLKTILFYQWNSSNNDYIFIFGENNDTTPGAKLDSMPYTGADSMQWKSINLTAPLVLPAGTDFWVAVRVNHTAGTFPLGCDVGPCVHDRGGFISTNGTRWQNLPDLNPTLDFNWNIRAVIARIPGLAHDVGVTRILAPGTNVPVGSHAPVCRIVNFGANPESNIPVTCWIDSGGGHVYNQSTSYPGPLAPGSRADVTFSPSWNTGPAGNSYAVSMFTTLGGDLNPANDTAHQTTTTTARFAVMTHDTGYCKLSVTALGSIGYDAPPGLDAGIGFSYPKASASELFYSSLALGNSISYVVDRYYGNPATNYNTDFQVEDSLWAVVPPGSGDEHFRCVINDAGHATPKTVTVTQNSYMTAATGYDDFVVLVYDVHNGGASSVDGLYAGVFADFDIGSTSTTNQAMADTVRRCESMRQSSGANPTVGVKILDPTSFANLAAVDHNIYVYPTDTAMTDNMKYRFLNGTIVQRNSNRDYDWSICVSVGPFDLPAGGDYRCAFAFVGGTSAANFAENADSAQSWYDNLLGVSEREGVSRTRDAARLACAPNPFNNATQVRYFMPAAGRLELEAYDATGRLVDQLVTDVKAGVGVLNWRPQGLGAGLYFLKVRTPGRESVIKALRTE